MKFALNLIGCIAVALGILGIFLPLLPTTPFLLLASACFARGSTRLHNWLLNTRPLGVYIRNVEEGRGIPLRAKIVAISLLWVSLTVSALKFPYLPLQLALLAIGAGVTFYLVRLPLTPPAPPQDPGKSSVS